LCAGISTAIEAVVGFPGSGASRCRMQPATISIKSMTASIASSATHVDQSTEIVIMVM
jgi:hypothetical protein